MMREPLLTVAGTRPELIKLAPVIRRMHDSHVLEPVTCFSGQHVEILDAVLDCVGVAPDIDLREPPQSRSLSAGLAWLLERLDTAVREQGPSGVVVQGDTNTALAGALTAFHNGLPCFHVEAGLRTSTPDLPFPEEMNRRLIGRLASMHFCPTRRARGNLIAEGVPPQNVLVTGNTGIDAMRIYAARPCEAADEIVEPVLDAPPTRMVLVTLHRRENAESVRNVTAAVRQLAMWHPDVRVLWILHHNAIRHTVVEALGEHPAVTLVEPQPYRVFVKLMQAAELILSDSGGVQEEAPVLGKPLLVLREQTERPEAVEAGSARVVGCHTATVVAVANELLSDSAAYAAMSRKRSPFGDGRAADRIVRAMQQYFDPGGAGRVSSLPPSDDVTIAGF
jgi:UDP-N-acetylglucosamine 2-epimerase (non-hydrolysing)